MADCKKMSGKDRAEEMWRLSAVCDACREKIAAQQRAAGHAKFA
jgi:hypothetical protein